MNIINLLEKSKCSTCEHRLSRLLEPITQEDKDYYAEIFDLEDTDDFDLFLEQYKCLITGEDLDTIVHECSMYTPINRYRLIREFVY